jgi:hypothetical protein
MNSELGGLMVVIAALLACASAESVNERLRNELLRRASFDLDCRDPLETTPLQTQNEIVQSYGVAGCGRRATYVKTPTGVWVVNSTPEAPKPGAVAP